MDSIKARFLTTLAVLTRLFHPTNRIIWRDYMLKVDDTNDCCCLATCNLCESAKSEINNIREIMAHNKPRSIPNAVTLAVLTRLFYQEIEVGDLETEHEKSISYQTALFWLTAAKMVKEVTKDNKTKAWNITARGSAFIEHILTIPLPQEMVTWVIPATNPTTWVIPASIPTAT
jgi:hypothetical protein